MAREYQENLVTPINMTCYLCNESLGSSLCNYCKSQFPFHDLDDNAFKIVLYEFQHGTISYDADHLETLFFNPILDQHSTLSDPNSDLDPDLNNQNYASFANYCNYETAEDLNGVIGGSKLISFSLFHLNARSLVKNQDALAHLLANINHKFSVLAITETWVKDSNVNDLNFRVTILLATIALIKLAEELGSLSTKTFHIKSCQSLMFPTQILLSLFSLKFAFHDIKI